MWESIRSNQRKSVFLVVFMAALLFGVGYTAGEILLGPGGSYLGLAAAFLVWILLTLIAYFQGRGIFMAVSGAQKIQKKDHPRLYNVVEEMTIASQLSKIPDIYIIDDPSPNAFAAGRAPEVAAVAITTGLLNKLNRDELQGVIAHEIGHIKNRDVLFMTMIGVMMGAIVLIADITVRSLFFSGGRRRTRMSNDSGGQIQIVILVVGIVLMILAPILAQVIYLAASRKREYLADASAAQFTRYPEGLANALEKIGYSALKMKKANRVTAPMYIVNPLKKLNKSKRLFSTHPPIDERVKILRSMGGGSGYLLYDNAFKQVTGSSSSVVPASARAQKENELQRKKTEAERRAKVGAAVGAIATAAILTEPETPSGKARETSNAIWKARNYKFIDCQCGAQLKVPPSFTSKTIKCLRCRREHNVPKK